MGFLALLKSEYLEEHNVTNSTEDGKFIAVGDASKRTAAAEGKESWRKYLSAPLVMTAERRTVDREEAALAIQRAQARQSAARRAEYAARQNATAESVVDRENATPSPSAVIPATVPESAWRRYLSAPLVPTAERDSAAQDEADFAIERAQARLRDQSEYLSPTFEREAKTTEQEHEQSVEEAMDKGPKAGEADFYTLDPEKIVFPTDTDLENRDGYSLAGKEFDSIDEALLAVYGEAKNTKNAAWMLSDGTLLDFKRSGDYSQDHRTLVEVLKLSSKYLDDYDEQKHDGEYNSDEYALQWFERHGNIRLVPEIPGIEIHVTPTQAQVMALREWIQWALRGHDSIIVEAGSYFHRIFAHESDATFTSAGAALAAITTKMGVARKKSDFWSRLKWERFKSEYLEEHNVQNSAEDGKFERSGQLDLFTGKVDPNPHRHPSDSIQAHLSGESLEDDLLVARNADDVLEVLKFYNAEPHERIGDKDFFTIPPKKLTEAQERERRGRANPPPVGEFVVWDHTKPIDDIEAHSDFWDWFNDEDPESYYPDFDVEFSDEFWRHPPPLYHATSEDHVRDILHDGLEARAETRGLSNRFVGSSVFTTTEREEAENGAYGDFILEIDTPAMKRDGLTPFVFEEPDIVRERLRSGLAARFDREYEEEVEGGVSPFTVALGDNIPAKYLKLVKGELPEEEEESA